MMTQFNRDIMLSKVGRISIIIFKSKSYHSNALQNTLEASSTHFEKQVKCVSLKRTGNETR